MRCDRQHASLAQDAAPRTVRRQRHPAEMAALHAFDAVVLGQTFVEKRKVGGQQLGDRAILANHGIEEQLGFPLHRLAQRLIEGQRKRIAGTNGRHVPDEQPLGGKIPGERRRTRIGQHPSHLTLEHRRILELVLRRHRQEFVVGNAAPDEERETGRQIDVADPIDRRCRACTVFAGRPDAVRVGALGLDAEQEIRVDQEPADGELDPGLEAAILLAAVIEKREQGVDVLFAGGAAIGTIGQLRDDPLGARRLLRLSRRLADENAAAAGRVARTGRVVRADD